MPRHLRLQQASSKLWNASAISAALKASGLSRSPNLRGRHSQPPCLSCQKRAYATIRVPKPSPPPTEVYSLDGISAQAFAQILERNEASFDSVSPAQYYEGLAMFTEAIKKGSSPWSVRLAGDNHVPTPVLHEIACILRHIQDVKSAQALTVAIWASASELGHRPSTLSLARLLIRSGAWGKMAPLRKAETRFKGIVSEGRDPNALTAEGELLYEQGRHDAAVKTLRRALRLGGATFEWKPHCQLCLGKALAQLQKPVEASDALEAAAESGSVEADGELGQLLRTSNPEKASRHLYAAAMNGRPDLFRHLSEVAIEKQAASTDAKAVSDHARWAMEWSKLADPSVPY